MNSETYDLLHMFPDNHFWVEQKVIILEIILLINIQVAVGGASSWEWNQHGWTCLDNIKTRACTWVFLICSDAYCLGSEFNWILNKEA